MLKRQSESDIQTLILDWLNRKGVFSFRVNTAGVYDSRKNIYRTPGRYTLKGTSDVLGILPTGRFLAVEVKSATGRVTVEQRAFLDRINKSGGIAFVARSLQDVERNLHNEI